jgi:hypothetical protein
LPVQTLQTPSGQGLGGHRLIQQESDEGLNVFDIDLDDYLFAILVCP